MSTFSALWYRVANYKPQLRSHFDIHRQPYGKNTTYLLQDLTNGKLYRFNESAYELIGRLDGKQNLQQIWEALCIVMQDDAPTQDDVIGILGRLNNADALQGNLPPDFKNLYKRDEKQRRRQWLQKLASPFSIKIPLVDPDNFLKAILPVAGLLFTPSFFVIWMVILVSALMAAAPNFHALQTYASLNALEVNNLIVLGLLYPLIKLFHELAHAVSTRKWGGEVHEMGISFLVFMPIPYVDASSSVVCRYKYQRMIVSAAGMMIEVFLASLALFVWLNVEDSLVRNIAFNIIIIAGVSTLLFNSNPLLKFDAYYILEDLLEIPNLSTRSKRYLHYLLQRYLLRIKTAVSPCGRSGESFWLLTYGITSSLYRILISFGIIWLVAGKFFVFGLILALWAVISMLFMPIFKAISFLFVDPALQQKRLYGITLSTALLAPLIYVFCVMPLPSVTRGEGVVYPGNESVVKATGEGFVSSVNISSLDNVKKDQTLINLDAPLLTNQQEVIEAELEELKVRHRISINTDTFAARLYEEQFEAKQAELDKIKDNVGDLSIRSPAEGKFIPLDYSDMKNAYIRKGDILGYVINDESFTIKTIIPQSSVGQLRDHIEQVSVVFANDINKSYPARIVNSTPAASYILPSSVLGKAGGGKVTVDPGDEKGLQTIESVFLYELQTDAVHSNLPVGLRAYVRFHHGNEPLLVQCYRHLRQLMLGRFGV